MYRLYWSPGGANMAPHAALEEIGAEFELVKVDLDHGGQLEPDYPRLNPHARVPTLVHEKDQVMHESAAIYLFLAERHPEARLAPPLDSPQRGPFLQWMAYLTNTVQEALMQYWETDHYIAGEAKQAQLRQKAQDRLDRMWEFLDSRLVAQGPYLCGADPYVCDIYLAMLARWTRKMAQPAITHLNPRQLVATIVALPPYARMLAAEGIEQVV